MSSVFEWWAIENVMGAKRHMSSNAVEIFGQLFGLQVDRARNIETNFPLRIDRQIYTGTCPAFETQMLPGRSPQVEAS